MDVKKRDHGLDVLRAAALVLMVLAHFSRRLELETLVGRWLLEVGEAAPGVFFFAFGMTFDRFLVRGASEKIQRLKLFFFVAIAHNIYLRQFYQPDFLFFLFVWLAILSLVEHGGKKADKLYLLLGAVVIALMMAAPSSSVSTMFGWPQNLFPLLPWGLFVMAGLLYQRWRGSKACLPLACALVLVSVAMIQVGSRMGWDGWGFVKWPLSVPYLIFWCAVSVLVHRGAQRYWSVVKRITIFESAVNILSKNLLLGTVLHYLPVFILGLLAAGASTGSLSLSGWVHDIAWIFVGTGVCVVFVIALIYLVRKLWDLAEGGLVLRVIRARYDLLAMGLLVMLAIFKCMAVHVRAYGYPCLDSFRLSESNLEVLELLVKLAGLCLMVLFAMEMKAGRKRN